MSKAYLDPFPRYWLLGSDKVEFKVPDNEYISSISTRSGEGIIRKMHIKTRDKNGKVMQNISWGTLRPDYNGNVCTVNFTPETNIRQVSCYANLDWLQAIVFKLDDSPDLHKLGWFDPNLANANVGSIQLQSITPYRIKTIYGQGTGIDFFLIGMEFTTDPVK